MSCSSWCKRSWVFISMSEQNPKPEQHPATEGDKQKRKAAATLWGLPLFMIVAGAIFLLTSCYALYLWQITRALPGSEQPRLFVVEKGDTLSHVLRRLEADDVIASYWLARFHAWQSGQDRSLKAGEFEIPQHSSLKDLLVLLNSNNRVQYRIALLEGQTFKEWRKLLAGQEALTQAAKTMDDEALFASLRGSEEWMPKQPEGMFYPDTYFYHRGDTDISILARAHQRQRELIAELWPKRRDKLPLRTPYEAIILASIIEKETGHPDERPAIAGVFVRRLEQGMRLQTDPTIIYGLGDSYQGNITRAHLRETTAYNTYQIDGLTPTPIAMPSRAAIEAALQPANGDALYFVARGDGSHVFSATLEAHEKAVQEFQIKRRQDYRSEYRPENGTPAALVTPDTKASQP